MISVFINDLILDRAKKLFDFKKLNGSITDGDGNLAGALGEVIVCEHYKGKQQNTFDYDLILNSLRIDVKSKRFTSKFTPNKNWNLNISDFNTRQDCDHYCFVGISDDYKQAFIYGFISKSEFFKVAIFGKKGQIDPNGNGVWTYRADCYNILISQLHKLGQLANYVLDI